MIVSLTLDDLDTIIKALDSADFYTNDSTFYEHLGNLKLRLEKLLEKWEKIKNVDEKIKWNNTLLRLGRGFETIEEYEKKTNELYEIRNNLKHEKRNLTKL